jgi:hypothetical protein
MNASVLRSNKEFSSQLQETNQPVEKCPAEFMRKDELNNPPSQFGRAKTKGKVRYEMRIKQGKIVIK